jgi:hypothetical protein
VYKSFDVISMKLAPSSPSNVANKIHTYQARYTVLSWGHLRFAGPSFTTITATRAGINNNSTRTEIPDIVTYGENNAANRKATAPALVFTANYTKTATLITIPTIVNISLLPKREHCGYPF